MNVTIEPGEMDTKPPDGPYMVYRGKGVWKSIPIKNQTGPTRGEAVCDVTNQHFWAVIREATQAERDGEK